MPRKVTNLTKNPKLLIKNNNVTDTLEKALNKCKNHPSILWAKHNYKTMSTNSF